MMKNSLTELSDLLNNLESLKTFNDKLVEAINSSHEGIALIDKNGFYTYMNEAYEKLFGYNKGELIGSSWTVLYRDSTLRLFKEQLYKPLISTGKWTGDAIAICKDGKTEIHEKLYLTLMSDGSLICTCRDKNQEF